MSIHSGRLIAKNTVLNLIGNGLPLLAGLFSLPYLISGFGVERFGLLSIAWVLIGYFSLFDLGLGRALTQVVANKLGAKKQEEIPTVVWSGLALMLGFSLLATFIIVALSPWLVNHVFKITGLLKSEALYVFYILASSVSVVLITAGLRGVLEAYQLFWIVNLIRVPMGLFTFLGPLLTLPYSGSLVPAVSVLVVVRVAGMFAYLWFCLKHIPSLRSRIRVNYRSVYPLLAFGGWMTVSNIVGPLMVYFDRFLIGSMISLAAVAYYTTPYEVVTKLWIIPGALAGVLFPSFASAWAENKDRLSFLYDNGLKFTILLLFPITLFVVLFAPEGLTLWLGDDFASKSERVMQWLMMGVFLNSLAQITFGFIQGVGRPDITAKLHVVQFFPYVLVLWWLLNDYGIEGAAIAWFARIAIDLTGLMAFARLLVNDVSKIILRYTYITLTAIIILWISAILQNLLLKILVFTVITLLFLLFSWQASNKEIAVILERFKKFKGLGSGRD